MEYHHLLHLDWIFRKIKYTSISHPIPRCRTLRNQFRPIPGIPGINSKRNRTESDGLQWIGESELIPGAEPVPQCSTLRNRMYSLYFIWYIVVLPSDRSNNTITSVFRMMFVSSNYLHIQICWRKNNTKTNLFMVIHIGEKDREDRK